MRSPVLLLVFNRPDVTKRVFDVIRQTQPSRLYLAADAPRKNRAGEAELCKAVQEIISQVDWPCEVSKLIRQENLGCKEAVTGAIDWFFSHESEGIILEDDCLPNPDFFVYCDELLEKYRDDERVGMISGDNFQGGVWRGDGDYYFSRFCHIWGWATWARAWKKYDSKIIQWPQLRANDWLGSLGFQGAEKAHWIKAFDRVHGNQRNTWDYQWVMTCWLENMLSIAPNVNLISNIGFGDHATHTVGKSIYSNMRTGKLEFPLTHPSLLEANKEADLYSSKNLFTNSIVRRVIRKLRGILGFKA
ncbi:glycosyltransferase family 2 protein [Polynucleobacter necessarius]|uniref:glycosyltransferase family 2 protein n=1 Tax=Polynucleobacter necessarius TaxID=576610 RepID=UPI000FE220F6|nr:glycosyltransferase family 2 protein [Polynucleobacter necessarius]